MQRPNQRYFYWIVWLLFLFNASACNRSIAAGQELYIPKALANPTEPATLIPQKPIIPQTTKPLQTSTPQLSPTTPAGLTPTPGSAACQQKEGKVVQDSLVTDLLPKSLQYYVYLPPCYDEETGRRYPVLYLIHGQSFTHNQWLRLGIDKEANELIAAGQIQPLIIVLPRDRVWELPTTDKFGQAVIEVLLPYIDQQYRTVPDRAHRAIGGLSRGAGWAVHLGLTHWELFGAIGADSLPIFWSDTPNIRRWLKAIPAESMPRFFLDIGDKDRPEIMKSATWFEQMLTDEQIPHEWYLFNGFHEEAYWQAHVKQYLLWYGAGWEDAP